MPPHGEDQRAGPIPQLRLAERVPGDGRPVAERDLLEPELERPFAHDDVEELRDVGSEHEGSHARTADALRVDHPVGTGSTELLDALAAAGACDDEELGSERTGAEDDEGVGRVTVDGRHESSGSLDAGRSQHSVIGRVADDDWQCEPFDDRRCGVDDHEVAARPADLVRDRLPHPPPSADDDVALQRGDRLFHATSPEQLVQATFDQGLDEDAEGVERGAHSHQDQHDREHLAGRREGLAPRGSPRSRPW